MKCSFHPDQEAVITCGYSFCVECARNEDMKEILRWAMETTKSIPLGEIVEDCRALFGGEQICFANFPILYNMLPRGSWIEKDRQFVIPQKDYFQAVFQRWVPKKGTIVPNVTSVSGR